MCVSGVAAVRVESAGGGKTPSGYDCKLRYDDVLFENQKYYFTACAVLFVLLLLLTLMRDGWTLTPQSLLSMLVGWLLLCAVIIGVVYLVVGRRRTKSGDTPDGEAADRE